MEEMAYIFFAIDEKPLNLRVFPANRHSMLCKQMTSKRKLLILRVVLYLCWFL